MSGIYYLVYNNRVILRQTLARRPFKVFMLYSLLLYTVWAIIEIWLTPSMPSLQNEWVKEIAVKGLVWVLPTVFLIYKYRFYLLLQPKVMFRNKGSWGVCLPWIILFSVYIGAGSLIQQSTPDFSISTVASSLVIALSIGVAEEIVFRGWLLNLTIKLLGETRKRNVIALNAVMFLLIHFPIWVSNGELVTMFTGFGFLSILALSVIFSVVFLKSRSIWPPIILHTYWNFLFFILLK